MNTPMNEQVTLQVGQAVQKVSGYPFPGVIVARFLTLSGKERFVVECTAPGVEGCLHIYNAKNLAPVTSNQSE